MTTTEIILLCYCVLISIAFLAMKYTCDKLMERCRRILDGWLSSNKKHIELLLKYSLLIEDYDSAAKAKKMLEEIENEK